MVVTFPSNPSEEIPNDRHFPSKPLLVEPQRAENVRLSREQRTRKRQIREASPVYDALLKWTLNPDIQEILHKINDLSYFDQVAGTLH